MANCLPSRRRNPTSTSANLPVRSGPYIGEAGRSMGRSLLSAIVALVALAGVHPWADAQNPSAVGQFSSVMSWPFNPTHAVLLENGNVLWWPSFGNGDQLQIWDPATGTNTPATPAGYNIFCGGHSVMGNGQVLVTGGDSAISTGMANASLYDPVSGNWTFLPDMNAGRWYPTNTVLPNGDTVITSGEISPLLGNNPLPQVWQASSSTWRDLTTAQLDLPLYPEMYLAPNGTLFYAGPDPTSKYLNTDGTGSWTIGPNSEYGNRVAGSSVMYNNDQVMIVGGGAGPTPTAEIINLNAPVPTWSYTGTMANPRRNANATLLPDGTVLVTGGTSGAVFDDYTHPVFPNELWNPATGTWSTLASLSVYRGYHSVALLLPDGRVLSGGGQCFGDPGCNPNSAEIFSPPYLFAGTRPTITSAPASISGGQTFFVATPDAANITQVTWIRSGAVTHSFNQEQRINFLSFSQATGGLNVTAPPSANLAPPGFYMLFLLSSGVPSVASIIQVDNSSFAQSGPAVSVSQAALSPFAAGTWVGTTSASKPVQLTNLGTTPVTINSITTGSDFTVASNTCGAQLAPGSCTINVAFKPIAGGRFNEFLTINDSDSSSPQTVALSGTGKALKSSASALNFGNLLIGATGTPVSLTLTNLGTAAISITSISYSNPEFGQYLPTSTCGTSIPGLSSCQVFSVFTPNAPGTQSATLSVSDSDPSSPTTVSLSGSGVALTFSPDYIGFGNEGIPGTHSPVTITVTNAGSVAVNFSSIAIGGTNSGDFAIQTNTCGASVGPDSNCVVGVTFTPQAIGARSATLSFTDNSGGSPQVVGLAGHGVGEPSSVVVTSNSEPSTSGQSITFTATVSPNTATGTVQFLDGGSLLGTGAVSAGTASFASNSLAAGTNSITAVYSGDTIHAGSTSAVLTQTVNQVMSSTSSGVKINLVTAGQTVTSTAMVPSSTTTGSVRVVDLSNGTKPSLGTALASAGKAVLRTDSITSVYGGDTNNTSSASALLVEPN